MTRYSRRMHSSVSGTGPGASAAGPTHDAVERLIEQRFDTLSPELQRAARWVLQNGTALALQSMRASARHADVAPATMTRLAQRLGFEGFEPMRAPFVRRLADGPPVPAVALPALRKERALAAVVQDMTLAQQAHVAAVSRLNTLAALVAAADAMLGAQTVYFLGMRISHGVAFQLYYAYSLLASNGQLLTHLGGTLGDQLLPVREGSVLVAISQSPYARLTADAVQTARRQGARVIALTDSKLSPIARDAAGLLLFGGQVDRQFHSISGAVALVEALLSVVAERGGAGARDHLLQRQRQLQQERAYWESPTRRAGRTPASSIHTPS